MDTWKTFRKTLTYIALYAVTFAVISSTFLLGTDSRNDFPMLRTFIIIFASILLTKYFIYMTVSPWYDVVEAWRKKLNPVRSSRRPSYYPRVSVIVPAWNEEVGLLATVKTILTSTYKNLEIIVVNDGSTDNSDTIMREFVARYHKETPEGPNKIGLIYRYKENGGKGRALNYGIYLASGDIIVSIDADCVLLPDTIANFVSHFEDPTVVAAVGNVKVADTSGVLGTLQYLEFLFSFYFKKADSLFNTIYIIGGAAGAFRREVFDEIGMYSHKNITEDIDLSVRIQEAGKRIVYASDAMVYTEGASTLEGLMKQRLRWKRGRFQTFFEHRHLFFSGDPRHNKMLTWLVLPFALFGDTQLFFEVLFLAFLYVYSYLTGDFSSFISGIIVVSSMFLVQMFDDKTSLRNPLLYFLAPIGWLLFYVTTVVEYHALIKSLWAMSVHEKAVWQRWERRGVFSKNPVLLQKSNN